MASACNRKPLGANVEDVGSSARAAGVPFSSLPVRIPTFHARGLGSWYGFISYEACVRLCLHAWAWECTEAPFFLDNECAVLSAAFGVKLVLLQSEEELLTKRSTELISEGASVKPKKTFGRMKVQVLKMKMVLDPPMKKLESVCVWSSSMKSALSSEWEACHKVHVPSRLPSSGTFSHQSLAYIYIGTKYIKELPELLKIGATAFHNSSASYEVVQDTYSCLLRLKSLPEEESVRMQPGSDETRVLLPDGLGDDLIIEINDSNGKYFGLLELKLQILLMTLVTSSDGGLCIVSQSLNLLGVCNYTLNTLLVWKTIILSVVLLQKLLSMTSFWRQQ